MAMLERMRRVWGRMATQADWPLRPRVLEPEGLHTDKPGQQGGERSAPAPRRLITCIHVTQRRRARLPTALCARVQQQRPLPPLLLTT